MGIPSDKAPCLNIHDKVFDSRTSGESLSSPLNLVAFLPPTPLSEVGYLEGRCFPAEPVWGAFRLCLGVEIWAVDGAEVGFSAILTVRQGLALAAGLILSYRVTKVLLNLKVFLLWRLSQW
jgi:hypothetical protein